VPSEIHTIETRLAGQTLTVFVNFLASFIIGAHPLVARRSPPRCCGLFCLPSQVGPCCSG
jgi:hypothetical protein